MLVVILLEFIAVTLILVILITQIIYPFIRGTKIFPIFRKEAVLTAKLEDVQQRVVEKELENKINKIKKQSL
jgi:hypothetical protein